MCNCSFIGFKYEVSETPETFDLHGKGLGCLEIVEG
jgi:hypothetical protein